MSDKVVVASPNYVLVLRKGAKQFDVLASLAAVIIAGGKRRAGNGYSPGEPLGDKFSFGFESPRGVGVLTRAGKKLTRSDIVRVAVCGGTEVASADAERVISQILAPPPVTVLGGEVPINLISNGATTEIADTELNAGRTSSGVFKDDFLDELHARTKAQIGPNGELLDDFDTLYQLQKGVHEELVQEAPFTRTNPPSALSGILGGQEVATTGSVPASGPIQNKLVTVAQWQAKSDAETSVVTCTFAPVQDPITAFQAGALASRRPFGVVLFGTRGFAAQVVCDIGQGAQLSVTASQVTLLVGMDFPNGLTPVTMPIVGMVSFSTPAPAGPPLTRTIYMPGGQMGGQTLPVPNFARTLQVLVADVTTGYTVKFQDGAGTTAYLVQVAAAAQMPVTPLSSDIAFINLTVNVGGNADARAIFGLGV